MMKPWEDLTDLERVMISDVCDEDLQKAELIYRTIRNILMGH